MKMVEGWRPSTAYKKAKAAGLCFAVFSLAALCGPFVPQAEAVQIKKVYRGVNSFLSGDTLLPVSIGGTVDTTKSIILLTSSAQANTSNSQGERNYFCAAQFAGNDTIQIERAQASTSAAVAWQVIEFEDGVYVQQGISTVAKGDLTKVITLPTALTNVNKAVPIVQFRTNTGGAAQQSFQETDQFFLIPTLAQNGSNTELTLHRWKASTAGNDKPISVTWQVIEFLKDAYVHTGTVIMPDPGASDSTDQQQTNDGAGSNSGALSPALTNNGDNALLFTYFTGGKDSSSAHTGIDSAIYTRGTIVDSTTLAFTRGTATATNNTEVEVRYYVVDFGELTELSIASSTNANPSVVTTSSAHGLETGQSVEIVGHATNTAINGTRTITRLSATTFSVGVAGNGTGGATGKIYVRSQLGYGQRTKALGGKWLYTDASNATPIVMTTSANHNFVNGEEVIVSLTTGNTNANGIWTVNKLTNTTFQLVGSAGNGNDGGSTRFVAPGSSILAGGDATENISSSTNASPIRITTSTTHNLDSGQTVLVKGHTTNTNANGWWRIKWRSTTTYDLTGSTGNGVGGATGTADLRPTVTSSSNPSGDTIQVTLNNHALGDNRLINISGHATNTNANGTWLTQNSTTNTFELTDGITTDGAPNGTGGTLAVAIEWDLDSQTAVKPDNLMTLISSSAMLTSASTTTTHADDLLILGHVLTRSGTTRLGVIRDITADTTLDVAVEKMAYEFPQVTLEYPDGGPGQAALVVGSSYTVKWRFAENARAHNWKLQYTLDGTAASPTWVDFGSWCGAGGASACSGNNLEDGKDTAVSNNNGSILFKVPESPNLVGTKLKFRIVDTEDSIQTEDATVLAHKRTRDASNNVFGIRGSVSNARTNPDASGSNYWGYNDSGRDVRWEQTGSFGTIRIDADYNGDGLFNASDNNYNGNGITGFPLATGVNGTLVTGSTYKYNWNNAWDYAATNLKVKVSADNDVTASGAVTSTTSTFEIRPTITVTYPVNGDTFNRGKSYTSATTPKTITWTSNGNVGNVDIYLSYDNGVSYNVSDRIAQNYSGGSPYNWTVGSAQALGTNCKIAVVKSGQDPLNYTIGSVGPASTGKFNIVSSIALTNPLAGQNPPWVAGDNQDIAWSITGGSGVTAVDILYRTDCSGSPNCGNVTTGWTAVPGGTNVDSGLSPFTWVTLPASVQGTATGIRIQDHSNPNNIYDQVGPFTTKPKLKFSITDTPQAGTVWRVGSNQTVSWTKVGTVSSVNVDLTDGVGGPTLLNLATGAAGTSASWNNISGSVISNNLSIHVYDPADSSFVTTASGVFSVKADITNVVLKKGSLTTDPVSSNYQIDDVMRIEWGVSPASLGSTVNVLFDNNSGKGANGIAGDSDDFQTFTIASVPASQGYALWNPIGNNSAFVGSKGRIRVVLQTDSAVSADSGSGSSDFTIKGSLQVTNPAGSPWMIGDTKSVFFTAKGIPNVNILYALDGSTFNDPSTATKTMVSGYATGTGEYQWAIPNDALDIASSNIYNDIKTGIRIRVQDPNDTSVNATTTADLTLRKRYQNIAVPSSVLMVDDNSAALSNITWTTKGNTDAAHPVKIFYDTNSGSGGYPNPIPTGGSNISDIGAYVWNVPPEAVSKNVKIRVASATDTSTVRDEMSLAFEVRGWFDFTAPPASPAPTLRVGGNYNVQWNTHGVLPDAGNPNFRNVSLLYSIDGSNYFNITTDNSSYYTNGSHSYPWNGIPDAARGATKLKIQYEADAANTFKVADILVKPSITITAPTTGTYHIGDALPLKFTHTGRTTDTWRFRYSIDGGSNWTTIDTVTSVNPNEEYTHATWNIPNDSGIVAGANQFKIRVEMVGDESNVTADSAAMTVLGSLGTVSLSGGGSGWTAADTTRQINWTRQGITAVKVEYTLDNGADNYVNTLATNLTADSYTWSAGIPGSAVSDQVKFRVSAQDANDSVTSATSSMITIKPQLLLISPNGPSTRNVGASMPIQWTSSGAGNIKVEYTTNADSGSPTWQTLAGYSSIDSAPQSDNNANVPDAVSSHVKFRLSNVTANPNLQVYSTSSTEFTIQTALTLDPITGPFTLGDTINVTWTPSGSVGNVTVEYYNGASWAALTTTAPQNGPYSLLLDAASGITNATNLAKIRISATNGLATPSTSSAFIVKPYLSVTSPAGNESWVVDSSHNIAWTIKGSNISQVALYYSKDSGSTYNNLIIDPLNINFAGGNDMTYSWTVPDDIQATKNMKVKVSTLPLSDPWAVSAVSNGLFQIVGQLAMKTPDDTTPVAWRIGSSHDIEWTNVHGSISAVKLEYSTNSGGSWATLISSTTSGGPGDHSYTWNIPNNFTIVKSNFRLRVSDASNSAVSDTSDAASSVLANFTVDHPLNGEVWVAETTNEIDWTTPVAGVPSNVKIEYNVGSGWTLLPENDGTANDGIVTNTGAVNWLLPANRTTAAQIRISDPNDSASTVTSNNFKIRGDFTVTSPNTGAEIWDIASTHNITWTKKGNVSAVKLQFSNNGGSSWSSLVDGNSADTQNIDVTGAGPYSFTWKIPDIIGQTTVQGLVRVVDTTDSTVYDSSDNNFTIKGNVLLSTPNGGETLGVGNVYNVTGVVNGVGITSVRLYYSTNGATYDYGLNEVSGGQVVSVVGGTFSQNWSVPDRIGSNLRVRVEDATNALVHDESDAAFSIKGTVALTSPTNLSVWSAGSQQNIVWDRNGNVGNVDLYYQVNNGTWNSIATSVSSPSTTGNTYAWTLPTSGIVSTNVKVKIDGANLLQPEISQAFNVKGAIAITYPDSAGISFTLGDPLTVTWSQSGSIGDVKVEYYDGSGWTTVTTSAPQDGPYQFTLDSPTTTVATAGAKIRVSQASDATVNSTSANAFMVKPLVQITSPVGNEAWIVDSSHNVTWSKIGSNVANVKIEYSKNSGSTFTDVIVPTTSNNGSYPWTIPDDIQSVKNMKVKVSTLPTSDLYAVQAVSSGLFQIVGQLAMKVPDDTTPIQWAVGSTNNTITWTNVHGSIANVKLEYSTNAGSSWSTLSATEPSGGPGDHSYSWNVPNNFTIVKNNFRIRVSDAANSAVVDASDAASSILASFAFDHPLSGEVWVAENSHDIEWHTPVAGVPSTVKIEYNVGSGWTLLAENDGTANDGIVTNSGAVTWTLPATRTPSAQLRISDPNDSASAVTSSNFKIRGDLTVTSPNTGAESWEIATPHPITWTKKGDISSVKLQFSNDGGGSWSALVDGNSLDTQNVDVSGAGPYSFNWTIPDIAGITTTQARIRVIDASDSTVFDASNNNFTTKGRVDLLTPDGGETLGVGNTYAVTGNVFGQGITSVRLYYSTNGGATYPYGLNEVSGGQVVSVSGGTFSQNWSVPDRLGSNLKVRVEDGTNSLVADESTTPFSIKGTVAITSPTNLSVWAAGTQQNIVWDRNGTVGNVDLYYQVNNGTWNTIATSVSSPNQTGNSYAWTLPSSGVVSTNVKVKIDGANLLNPDISQAFTVKGAIALTYPDAASIVLTLGDPLTVTWSQTGSIGSVKVEYFNGTSWSTLTTTAAEDGPYQFTLDTPITTVATAGAKIRISQANDASVTDTSSNDFMVKPFVQITSPAGNEAWVVGSSHNITWNKIGSNVSNVKIEYSKDSGSTYSDVINPSVNNTGSFAWTVPDDIRPTKDMKVRISTLPTSDLYAVQAVSAGLFQIVGALQMVTPDDTTPIAWRVGSTGNEIKWNATGSIATVKIEYSNNSGSTWSTLTPTANSGAGSNKSYSWDIPNNQTIVKDNFRIRVLDSANTNVYDAADAASSILASFAISHPDNTDVWTAQTPYDIQWSTPVAGVPATVKLEYDLGGGYQVIDAAASNTGAYNWTLPAGLSSGARVRISDPNDAASAAISDPFKIRGSLTLTSPTTGDSWVYNTHHNVTWTKLGNIAAVKLEYTTNGSSYTTIATGVDPATGTPFDWTVPDVMSQTVRVKVTDASDASVYSESGNFTIKGTLTMTAPNGGEAWVVGAAQNITWSKTGSISTVDLAYSTNGGGTYPNTIATGVSASAPYPWTIPDAIGSQLRVKVTDAANGNVSDVSDADFAVKGSLTLTAPNGGEILSVGSATNITWTRAGSIANIKIDYSTDGGSTYPNSIASVVGASDGSYSWTVPDALGLTAKVKITDTTDNSVFDVSNGNFTIRGALTVTAPNGGEVWKVGQQQDIVWQRFGSIQYVKIEYSTNGGSSYPNQIVSSTGAAAGSYTWTIPDSISIQAKVRVTDVNDSSVFDDSDANFAIKGTLVVTAPNGGEAWGVGTTHNVTWTRTGSIANVKIEYSTDGGTTYPVEIINSTDASSGSYGWLIPDDLTIQGRVKVTNVNDATVFDASNANFKIIGALTLTAPVGGEGWQIGTPQNITWLRTGSIGFVKIELSTNGGSTFPTQITPSTPAGGLSYNWTIPDVPTTTAMIRISDAADATVNNVSGANFKIQGIFTITSPNDGSEVWDVNSSHDITWNKVGSVASVRLEYSTDGGANYGNVIHAGTGNTGTFAWTIPDAISAAVRVRISDVNDYSAFDVSDNNFKIRGLLSLTSPNGGENWDVASSHAVTWSRTGSISAIKIEYSSNGGSTYPGLVIASQDAATGTYAWTIPDIISTQVRVKITDTSDPTVTDASDTNFTIKGALAVVSPNGGEQWIVNSGHNITWTRFGSIATVAIDYSTDHGVTFPNSITTSTDAALLSYTWTIPDDISTAVRVKVTDTSNAQVFDTSNADFAIRGSFTVTSPNGGETWIVGSSHNITWNRQGTIPNAKLEYSTNSGSTFPNVIVGLTDAAAGTYSWTVPDAIGTHVQVRISDVNNAAVFDDSNADMIVKGSLTLTAPNGSETWIVGAANNITWNRSGTISQVKLEYSTDGGNTYPNTIIGNANGLTGTYAWSVADAISASVRVRVSDASDPTVVDASDANFTVKGSITVTSPNGGEAWVVGTVHNVTWTKTGTISTVKIDYSTDSGSTYPNSIATTVTASAGTHPWTIPDDIQSSVRVKVTNNADSTVADASDTNLKITGAFTLTAPNGAEQWKVGQNNSITWARVGSVSQAKLELSLNAGSTFPITITSPSTPAGALSFSWSVPDNLTQQARVRISDASDATVFDVSDANFEIQASFSITSPNGGEVWTVASAQDITWNKVGSATNVVIEYSTNGGSTYPNVISSNSNNTGSYTWTVPDAISSNVKVRVSDLSNLSAYDVSDGNFKIRGSLTVTAPNGSESWNVSSLQNITWTKVGSIANVKIEYSTDSGSTYPNLVNGTVDAAQGTYAWTIPDAITANAKVKITDASDSTVFDDSNAVFRIRGTFTITQPNGSEVLDVGSIYTIQWTKVGSIADAKLEYSTDGGGTYPNVIVGSLDPATLQFDWTVPDSISTLVRVRIVDNNDSVVKDNSDANLKIRGVLTLTSPNGSEVWNVASVHNVTWTRLGSVATAKLEYSTNSGSTYPNTIITPIGANLLTYAWTVPDSISTQVRVRITNLSDATVADSSDADFKIAGVLTLTSPNGSEVWSVGSSQAISWTRIGSISTAKLEYSSDGGVNYNTTITSTAVAANQSYGWTVPDVISATMRVKISDASDATVFDASDGNFKIRGSFTLTAPNGNEGWVIGSSRNITWTRFGSIADAKLEYSTNGGTTFPNVIIGSVNASLLSYSWAVPDNATTQARVRISQVGDSTVFDDSDANFVIRAGFTVTAPVGGEAWAVASTHDITWVTGGTIQNVKLEYSTNGGNSYTTIIGTTTNNQTYPWVVPDAITTQARIKVSDVNDAQASDISPANFKIHGTFTLTSPNGAEQWLVGSSHNVTWTKTGSIANAKLEYSTDSGTTYPNLIQGSVSASALSYSWTIPDRIGSVLKVKITDLNDSSVTDVSDNVFTIKAAFTITAPNGGENWVVGSSNNIVWGTLGTVANVKLEYATDGGTAYSTINANVTNNGTFAWTVPDAITTQGRVRVSDVNDSTAFDVSDNNFKIRGSLTITAPNGGEKWNVGTNRIIAWDRTGSIPTVKLEYSSNNGTVYAPINLNANNTGSYSWTIPDAITTQALVRITDTSDNTVTDVSNASFKIMGNFTVTSPNGGEVWTITSARDITWTSSGTMNFAKIEYSTDGGATFPNLIIGSTNNNGLYNWIVPDGVSGQVRIRVSDPNDPDAYDDSNANFRIRMTFTLTSPNGGQKWPVASVKSVTWTNVGTIPLAKLQYSRDNFLGDIVTIHNGVPNNGSYAWTIPDSISSTVRVRVSDPNDIGAFDDSNADFKILGGFTVTSPNGGEKWDVGSTHAITWTPTGTVPDARIEYSVDGGATYPNTIIATPNNGSYDWLIPDTITAALKVRISDLNDAEAFDVTDVNAKIRAKFTLTAPNGSQIWTVGDVNNVTWTTVGTVSTVKLDYSTDSGTTYPGVVASTASNTGTYAWTIPDAISTNVRVRVMSATDVDAFDASDNNFKIRGKFTVTAPNGGEQWKIAQSNNITWTTTGTIANVKITYSMNGGSTFPTTIVPTVSNTDTYAWTVPDTPTALARIHVESVADATVYDESNANFSIQGFFTLTAPNGGEALAVAAPYNITWTWGGTIPQVKLTYSTDGGATYPNVIQASTANGAGSGGNHSYSWTVPDNISPTVRVKVEDPNDGTVFDASDANLKIVGHFTVTAPNGGERWVTYETRNITWNTDGTIPVVKLEYSYDNFTTATLIDAAAPNTGTYAWTLPDPGIANIPKAAKVRVTDVNDTTVNDLSNATFNIDYYYITWEVRDLLTNAALSALSVVEVKSSDPNFIQWSEAGIAANPPRVQPTPYGTWVATWSKTGYGEVAQVVIADQDQSILLYMETSAVHIWLADSRVSYDADADKMDIVAWLSRDGSITTGGISSTYKIYDGATLLYTLTDNSIDAAGFFNFQVNNPTGFVAGKTYTAICEVAVGSGGVFKTPTSFEVSTPKTLESVKDTINANIDKPLSQINTELQQTLNAQTAVIQQKLDDQSTVITTKLDQQTTIIQQKLDDFEASIQTSIVKLEDAAVQAQESAQTLQDTALKFSWKAVVAPNPALSGDKILLQAQGPSGLHPYLSVYNHKNKQVIANGLMNEDPTRPGNYDFEFKANAGDFDPGQAYTYIVTEDVTGGLVAGSGFVESISLTSVAGLASSAPAAEKAAKEAVEAIRELESTMAKGGDIRSALKTLQKSVLELPGKIESGGGETKAMRNTVDDISKRIQKLAGEQGLDLSEIVGKAIDESATVQDIGSRSKSIEHALELLGAVVQKRLGGAEDPIVATFLE